MKTLMALLEWGEEGVAGEEEVASSLWEALGSTSAEALVADHT